MCLISVKPVGLFNFSRDKLKTKCIQKENSTAKFSIPFSYSHQKQKRTVECTKAVIDDLILANLIHLFVIYHPIESSLVIRLSPFSQAVGDLGLGIKFMYFLFLVM